MLGSTPVGGHAPAAGGLAKASLRYVGQTDATAVQVYVSNPRGWALTEGDPGQDAAFLAGCGSLGVSAFVHAALLVNLGSPTEATVERSVATLEHALRRGKAIGAQGVVFHAGSAVDAAHAEKALDVVRTVLRPLLDRAATSGWPPLLVEPSAGGGRSLASRVEHLEAYLAAVDHHPQLGVCFDTCHAWAAGHDLAAPGGMTSTLDALIRAVGPDRLRLIHANDSKDTCGSTRDRHESLGKGTIGAAAFAELVGHPAAAGVPLIVETPSGDLSADHAADIALLRAARSTAESVVPGR
ncbi:deoxyribonuclease IV [Dactylosporangium sp. NPDC005555]|uniref:deoxyribonuclease IV n=1 Tax=Dactylosporangium sp. NPDC005555 TaxID=3154889 RepID=UPI0033A50C2E